jgi:hypothetical protein
MKNASIDRSNANQTPASIAQYRRARAQDAEIAALLRETARLSNPELPAYVLLCGTITAGRGLTAAERIDISMDAQESAESWGMPMCLAMCEAFFEHVEARALARVAESRSPAIVLAWPTRSAAIRGTLR